MTNLTTKVLLCFRLITNLDNHFHHISGTVEVGSYISLTLNPLVKSVLAVFYCFNFIMVLFISNCLLIYSRNIIGDKVMPTGLLLPVLFFVHFLVTVFFL